MRAWRAHNKDSPFGEREAGDHRNERAGGNVVIGKKGRKHGDSQTGDGRRGKCRAVIGFEAPTGTDADPLVAIDELPSFSSLHQRFVSEDLVGSFGRTV